MLYLIKHNKIQFVERLFISIRSRLLLFWNPDPKCRAITAEHQTYKSLKNKFTTVLRNSVFEEEDKLEPSNYTIWVCWLQGFETAPDLVKVCVERIKQQLNKYNIVLLDESNYKDYVTLPDYIVTKYNCGVISRAHFSDILRIWLLNKWGGVWIDSTVYCTVNELPSYVTSNSLFVYSSFTLSRIGDNKISSWMLAAKPHNKIISATKILLEEYWKRYDYLLDYYLLHLLFSISADYFMDDWDKLPKYHNLNPHILQYEFSDQYCEERMKEIERFADFHKLTYRLENKCNKPGTYYDVLINKVCGR